MSIFLVDLVESIERGIDKENDQKAFYKWASKRLPDIQRDFDPTVIHVSDYSVGLEGGNQKCPKQLWLRLNGAEKKPPTLGEKIMFDHGLRIQIRFSYLIGLGLPEDWSIGGILTTYHHSAESDLVLSGPDGDYIVEVKTLRGRAFDYLEEPRESHILQCRGYMHEADTDLGCVLYIDREGQNQPVQFPVSRDDDMVEECQSVAHRIANLEMEPDSTPDVEVKISENKTVDDSVKVSEPWQCQYCDYKGYSCSGTLDCSEELSGIVGRISEDGVFYTEEKYDHLFDDLLPHVVESEAYQNNYVEGGEDNDEHEQSES